MTLHAIAGLPRSGSTLLCNIINERPDSFATSTSCLTGFVRALGSVAAARVEFRNLLNLEMEATQTRYAAAVRAFCHQWHSGHGRPIVFDKSRAWNFNAKAFRDLSPDGKILLCVRDLRDVFASIERQEQKNGLITNAPMTMTGRYNCLFAEDGVIGGPYSGIIDLIDTNPDNVLIVHYESLVEAPARMLSVIEEELGLEPFAYDFDNVPDTATDPDGFYLGKFPHRASGKVEHRSPHWSEVVTPKIAADIMQKGGKYNAFFGYGEPAESKTKILPETTVPELTAEELAERELDRVMYTV